MASLVKQLFKRQENTHPPKECHNSKRIKRFRVRVFRCSGFRVQGSGFSVWGLEFRA